MASGYALPPAGGSHHGYSHSYSSIHLSPGKTASNAFPRENGNAVKKAVSSSNLYTHAEASRENSPLPSPFDEHRDHNHFPALDNNPQAFQKTTHSHKHIRVPSRSPMKSRPRGESDLGRPADYTSSAYTPSLASIPAASPSWFSLPEALTCLLIPLPYLLAPAVYSSLCPPSEDAFPPLAAYARVQDPASTIEDATLARPSSLIIASALTAGTLVVVGALASLRSSESVLDRRKLSNASSMEAKALFGRASLQSMPIRALSIGLPLYAAMQLGGMRVALILLVAISINLNPRPSLRNWTDTWASNVASSIAIILSFISDEVGLTVEAPLLSLILGYLALMVSILVLPPPLPMTPVSTSPAVGTRSAIGVASPLTRSAGDAKSTAMAGVALGMLTFLASMLFPVLQDVTTPTILLGLFTVGLMASAVLLSQPSTLRSESKAGLALGCLLTASCSFLYSPTMWPGTVCNGGLSALSFLGVLYDTSSSSPEHRHHHDAHDHTHDAHMHHHHTPHQTEGGHSALTKFIMARCEPGSLVSSILSEKDSRRIAYFTILNFGFMLVQGAYGYLSGSLGLLSDTVHMFFDCLGLVVGLGAAVASKWPTSPEKPYGWGKLNTLAGFGNGVFLMLVSVEFVWEAIEGIVEKRELRHVQELLVVSTLGLLVNLVGLFAFGHAHAGHDHGHSHGHSHDHRAPQHNHNHSHANGHIHSHKCDHDHTHDHKKPAPSHGHAHHNENMHGIFLHVAADAGGSLAVILSTALTLWKPWYLWDPLATIIIAVLIFAAAVPLVQSSGQKLLLVIPNELEYNIKNTLQELGELRGVMGFAVPRFWTDDRDGGEGGDAHGHHHHGHDHVAESGAQKVLGVIHVIAAPVADVEDVRERVEAFFAERRMEVVIHVEREADQCWCGGSGAPKAS